MIAPKRHSLFPHKKIKDLLKDKTPILYSISQSLFINFIIIKSET